MICDICVIEGADIPSQEESKFIVRLSTLLSDEPKDTEIASSNPPNWNSSEFNFEFTSKDDAELEVTLLNGDKEIGKSTLSLSDLENGEEIDKWAELKATDGSDAGRIRLSIKTEEKEQDLDDILNLLDDELEVEIPEFNKDGLENKEFQSKLQKSDKKDSNDNSDINLDDLIDGNKNSSEDDLIKRTCVAVTVVDVKNADQIPQIASNIESAELYCTLSLSENNRTVKTKSIKDPSTSSWNQLFKFRINDTSSAKIIATLYSANEDTKNEEFAKGEFTIDDITEKKNITVDLQSTQNQLVSAQLEISIESIPEDEYKEEEEKQEQEQEIVEKSLPQALEEYEDDQIGLPQNEQVETHDEQQEQIETHEEEQNQVETHDENEQQEQIYKHDENEQQEQIETHEEEQNQIETHDEVDHQEPIETHEEEQKIELLDEQLEEEKQEPNETYEEKQIELLDEQPEEEEKQEQIETHEEEQTIELLDEQPEEEEKQEQIETHEDEQNQIETHDEERIETHEEEEQNQIETHDEEAKQYQIEMHDDVEQLDIDQPQSEQEEPQQYSNDDEILKNEDENQLVYGEEDYEEEQYNETNAPSSSSSPRPRNKKQKIEHSLNKLLTEVHNLDIEVAEKEKEEVYEYAKSKAGELYQSKVISPVIRKEENSRAIILKLTKNSEELEKLHERMSKPENMSPLKLKREIKKLQKEIQDLDNDINDLTNENDELANIVFNLQKQINNVNNE